MHLATILFVVILKLISHFQLSCTINDTVKISGEGYSRFRGDAPTPHLRGYGPVSLVCLYTVLKPLMHFSDLRITVTSNTQTNGRVCGTHYVGLDEKYIVDQGLSGLVSLNAGVIVLDHVFPILDVLSRSGNIRDQSWKLCQIGPNFACFWPPNLFRGEHPIYFGLKLC